MTWEKAWEILNSLKKSAPLWIMLCLPFLAGCMEAPAEVLTGHDTAASCVVKSAQDYRQTISGLEAALRAERKAHADYALEKSYENAARTADAQGKIDAVKALAYIREAHAARDKAVSDLDAVILKFREAAAAGDREAALALDMMGALRKYDAVGVDPVKAVGEVAGAVPALLPGALK